MSKTLKQLDRETKLRSMLACALLTAKAWPQDGESYTRAEAHVAALWAEVGEQISDWYRRIP